MPSEPGGNVLAFVRVGLSWIDDRSDLGCCDKFYPDESNRRTTHEWIVRLCVAHDTSLCPAG